MNGHFLVLLALAFKGVESVNRCPPEIRVGSTIINAAKIFNGVVDKAEIDLTVNFTKQVIGGKKLINTDELH